MRILAIRTKGLVRPSIHDSAIVAFRTLGVHVLDFPVPGDSRQLQSFMALARNGGYRAAFTLDLGGEAFFIGHLKDIQRSLKMPLIVWFVDDPEGYGFPGACDPDWTLAFCWDRQIANGRGSQADCALFYLPLAADPTVFYPTGAHGQSALFGGVFVGSTAYRNPLLESVARVTPWFANDAEAIWSAYKGDLRNSVEDLVWQVGSRKSGRPPRQIKSDPLWRLWANACLHEVGIRKRLTLVSHILGRGGRVYGDRGWLRVVGQAVYGGPVDYGQKIRTLYNRGAFVLDTRQPQARTGLTQRIFDGAACAVPVITEWSSELDALFEPHRECLPFYTMEEGILNKERCCQDPRDARKIGRNAFRRVLAHHTYLHRAREILATLERLF